MLIRSTALLLALTALTACSQPQTNSTASTSETEAPASTPEEITNLKAVAIAELLQDYVDGDEAITIPDQPLDWS